MTKLFIIGNGFDLAHKMNTRYSDFRKFLTNKGKEHDNFKEDIYYNEIPAPTLTSDGEEVYNPLDRLNAILTCVDNTNGDIEWNKFEENLGKLNYECLLNPYVGDNDEKLGYKIERNENNARNIKNVLGMIPLFFQEWVKAIKIAEEPLDDIVSLINPKSDLFLTFNYTDTLERLYNVENVCHIHGNKDESLYVGHGENIFDPDNDYSTYFSGSEYDLRQLHEHLRKNTDEAFKKHSSFLGKLREVANKDSLIIYSYGFSFSKVDRFYLEQIFSIIDSTNICFMLNEYNDKDNEDFKHILRESGFKGIFGKYSIIIPKNYPFRKGLFKDYQYPEFKDKKNDKD